VIQSLALAAVADQGRLLMMRIESDGHTTYRPIGGLIETGEYGSETIEREFARLLGCALTAVSYLGPVDHQLPGAGRPRHEVMLLFAGELVDPKPLRAQTEIPLGDEDVAVWIPIADVLGGAVAVDPPSAVPLLRVRYG
jgi:ADP-ribose pyrophosphatase YjhB (NUDIX family)